ncbi:hypothetical protein E4T49_04325 [Aureobasidium sp. EXF-10728]|nr:hypothetical protein E4T49_04325 [Aureobasidium sp. EXF-10728]
MGMQYQPMYQTVNNDPNMQSFFVEPQLQPQPQPQSQFYGLPPPTGSSLDSGYAGEDINPFENNGLCPELKMDYVQHIAPAVQSYDTFGYMTNDQQPHIPSQPFMPVNFSGPFAHSFEPMKQDLNMSQSPPTPTLVLDDAISVKSEDLVSDAASPMTLTHPRSQLPKQNKRRPSTIRRTVTEPSMEVRSGSIQRTTAKESRARGRKRIPHTAVERRYRENLNLHLENLRHAMPFLQAAQRRRASDVNDPMKPSKCEILVGALEYIKRLESEVKELKQGLGE